jgi:hypothetical protein
MRAKKNAGYQTLPLCTVFSLEMQRQFWSKLVWFHIQRRGADTTTDRRKLQRTDPNFSRSMGLILDARRTDAASVSTLIELCMQLSMVCS